MKIITRAEALERKLKRYFNGKPCPQGHIAERATQSGVCLVCNNTVEGRKMARENTNKLAMIPDNYYGYAEGLKDNATYNNLQRSYKQVDKYPAFANWLVKSKEGR